MPVYDLLDPNKYEKNKLLVKARKTICTLCPLDKRDKYGRCIVCGCLTNLKCEIHRESCPKEEW